MGAPIQNMARVRLCELGSLDDCALIRFNSVSVTDRERAEVVTYVYTEYTKFFSRQSAGRYVPGSYIEPDTYSYSVSGCFL